MISTRNNWGFITFWNEDIKLERIQRVMINGKEYFCKSTDGFRTIYDSGMEITVRFTDWCIEVGLFGKLMPFKLSELIEVHQLKVEFID